MWFFFEVETATHAAFFFVTRAGGSLSAEKLGQLLYLADRESLILAGNTITESHFVNTTTGPALEEVSELLRGVRTDPIWTASLRRNGDLIEAIGEVDFSDSMLSQFDLSILDRIAYGHASLDSKAMHQIFRSLPEWRTPWYGTLPLDPKDILREAGLTEAEIQAYVELNAGPAALKMAVGRKWDGTDSE